MSPQGPRGNALTLALLLALAAVAAVAAWLAWSNQEALAELVEEQARLQAELRVFSGRLEAAGRERTRWRIESLEAKDRVRELEAERRGLVSGEVGRVKEIITYHL